MTRNMFALTPLFIATGLPSSSSSPASPPSPDISSSLLRTSSSDGIGTLAVFGASVPDGRSGASFVTWLDRSGGAASSSTERGLFFSAAGVAVDEPSEVLASRVSMASPRWSSRADRRAERPSRADTDAGIESVCREQRWLKVVLRAELVRRAVRGLCQTQLCETYPVVMLAWWWKIDVLMVGLVFLVGIV